MARTKAGFFFVKTLDGGPPAMGWYPLVGGTKYYEGQALRLSATSGSAMRQVAAGTAILGFTAADVTSSATTTNMPVYLAMPNMVFEGKMLASKTPRQEVGNYHDLAVATTHNHRVQGTASTKVLRVVDFHPDESLTAHTGGKYFVTVDKSLFGQSSREPTAGV